MNTFKKVCILLLAGAGLTVRAQEPVRRPFPGFPLTVSIFSESISLPSLGKLVRNPAGIGIRIGTELYYNRTFPGQWVQTFNAGYYHHKNFHHGFYVNTEFGYRHTTRFGLVLDGYAGIGYLQTVSASKVYRPTAGGEYAASRLRLHRLMPTLSAGTGYDFGRRGGLPVSLFARYELFGESPFIKGYQPILPHNALHVGTRINL